MEVLTSELIKTNALPHSKVMITSDASTEGKRIMLVYADSDDDEESERGAQDNSVVNDFIEADLGSSWATNLTPGYRRSFKRKQFNQTVKTLRHKFKFIFA